MKMTILLMEMFLASNVSGCCKLLLFIPVALYVPPESKSLQVRVAVISAKNHKRQRRKRHSNRQTRKVANAKGLNRNTNLA